MKNYLYIILFLGSLNGMMQAQAINDSTAIRETVANYVEGWYSADTVRMAKSLHPELAKRGLLPARDGHGIVIRKASFSDMVNWTGRNPDLLKQKKILKDDLTIDIIEIGKNIASVKCVSPGFIDYLHLARIENEWKILNAIWEPNYDSKK